MGYCSYKNIIMRIDIKIVPFVSLYTALLHMTGSAMFNVKIREIARKKNYKLTEYFLTDLSTNINFEINEEEDIFKILNIPYINPDKRY